MAWAHFGGLGRGSTGRVRPAQEKREVQGTTQGWAQRWAENVLMGQGGHGLDQSAGGIGQK